LCQALLADKSLGLAVGMRVSTEISLAPSYVRSSAFAFSDERCLELALNLWMAPPLYLISAEQQSVFTFLLAKILPQSS